MIDQVVANAITAYKLEERKSRQLLSNGLNILLAASDARSQLAVNVANSGIPELIEFYQNQLTVNDAPDRPGATIAALDSIETLITQLHVLVDGINVAAIAATGSPVFDGVMPIVEVNG